MLRFHLFRKFQILKKKVFQEIDYDLFASLTDEELEAFYNSEYLTGSSSAVDPNGDLYENAYDYLKTLSDYQINNLYEEFIVSKNVPKCKNKMDCEEKLRQRF